ncbi:MAG: hypothetical protein WBF47_10610 [Xanthobacteraceae bacterium]
MNRPKRQDSPNEKTDFGAPHSGAFCKLGRGGLRGPAGNGGNGLVPHIGTYAPGGIDARGK